MFESEIFENGLDDHIDLAEFVVAGGGDQVGHVLLSVDGQDLLPLDLFVHSSLNLVDASGQTGVVHVLQDGGHAFVNRHLGDTGAHQTCTEDADGSEM